MQGCRCGPGLLLSQENKEKFAMTSPPVERLSKVFMAQLSPNSFYSIRRELKAMI